MGLNNRRLEEADRLRELAPLILRCWEDRIRAAAPAAQNEDRLVLFDEIPLFLARVTQALRGELDAEESAARDQVGREHGAQRAEETDFPLNSILLEYQVLRKTICEVLETKGPISNTARETITDCIEVAMREAAGEFMQVHQDDLQRKAIALAEADRRKNEFVTTLAHELRTPLSAISNALYILENVQLDERAIQQLSAASRQTRNLARLIEDMMDISRISRGKIDLQLERLALAGPVSSAVDGVRPLIEGRGQDFEVSMAAEALVVEADPVRVEQIVGNLLNNAAKYTEPGGTISLTLESAGQNAVIRVKDTGIGIDPVVLPQIFDLFMQVDPDDARSRSGLGIGLSLVKTLVELQKGTIEVRSEGAGQGCEFIVRFPLVT